ncbi:PRK06851 family protein [Paenibacillus sp. GD4]|uniref:PRK06851 family protein n=1 Tax=Paenibacillus sp. GD4 TaxID=3068890 RepID=UPI002796928B|nr:PRK06851 family protein [Paenibacillus sp. GD4]MDQ1914402.1 PRK06851 family protein [Paenibacillus sp. GD4]
MAGNVKNYYAGGNTARGFANLFGSSLQGLERVYILKGGPGSGKSTLIRTIGNELAEQGYDIRFIHCASDNRSLDGVIVPKLGLGIVDGTAPHVIEPEVPGAVEQYVDLGQAWDVAQLSERKADIIELNRSIKAAYEAAYATYKEALRIHDEWEAIYIGCMDFDAANEVTEEYTGRLFGSVPSTGKAAVVSHRFLGAATPEGAVDFVPNLTEDVAKRYFIKGRPGSGKSTMLKKLAAIAEERGLDVEIYHCGFDPNSLDMIIVRELGVAMFDSTAPHEYFPERESDEIVDMYSRCITPGTDEKYAAEIADIQARYAAKMKEGTAHLAHAKSLRDQLEAIYVKATDFRLVDEARERIRSEIQSWIAGK